MNTASRTTGFSLTTAVFILGLFLQWGCAPRVQQRPSEQASKEPLVRVCLDENLRNGTIRFEGNFLLELEEAHYWFDENLGALNVSVRGNYITIQNKQRFFELELPQTLIFQPEYPRYKFYWNDIPYSGTLLIRVDRSHRLVINRLPVETYLQGVVPFEIPTRTPEYKEAVFAQAVAARTFTMFSLKHPENDYFDVHADERDQVYRGVQRTTPLSLKAIKDTRGAVLMQNGQPVLTQFHSTCGGVLEVAKNSTSTDSTGITMAYDLTDNEFNCKVSPKYRWLEKRSMETILTSVQHIFSLDSATVEKWREDGYRITLEILSRNPGGRVTEMRITINDRSFTAKNHQIRQVLADDTGKPLPSTLFFINQSPSDPQKFYIIGAGAGHGRGMCQWGAIGMALRGYSYKDILSFYYPEFSLMKLYE